MRNRSKEIYSTGFVLILAFTAAVFGQDSNPVSINISTQTRTVANGQKLKVDGTVVGSNARTFTLRGSDGTEMVVVLNQKTNIKMVRRFALDKTAGPSDIVRDLKVRVEGKGNSEGQLVAKNIRFDEEDLRIAQALESRVDPVETQANSARALAEANQKRLDVVEENARQLSGQIDELSAVANTAIAAAQNAQASADQARSEATVANRRINALDEYEVFKTVTVLFKPGSAELSAEAKADIDELIIMAQVANLKGWIVTVSGYADSTGTPAINRSLSTRRAEAVIDFLVTENDLPLQRLVRSFGYGSLNPTANNDTKEGRAMNRRVEIRVLVSKGISSQTAAEQATSQEQPSRRP